MKKQMQKKNQIRRRRPRKTHDGPKPLDETVLCRENQALELVRAWQKRRKSARCSLAALAKEAQKPISTLRNLLRRGVRRRLRLNELNTAVLRSLEMNATKLAKSLPPPKQSTRTIRRKTEPKRVANKMRRTALRRANYVHPCEHEELSQLSLRNGLSRKCWR